jgi:hypothetical protein
MKKDTFKSLSLYHYRLENETEDPSVSSMHVKRRLKDLRRSHLKFQSDNDNDPLTAEIICYQTAMVRIPHS